MKNTAQGALLVCGALMVVLCYFIRQEQFLWIVLFFGSGFILYIYAGYRDMPEGSWSTRYNLVIKIILIFAFPQASDDIYRFFWDGQVWLKGFSAYQFKPSELVQMDLRPFETVYDKLNSKEYYSVYPPALQILFGLCAMFSFKSIVVFSILWKSLLLLTDGLAIYFLKRLLVDNPHRVYWYIWNPLILFEVFGNGHPEGFVIALLVVAFYFISNNSIPRSATALGLAAGIKLIPVIIIPFIFKYIAWEKYVRFVLITGLIVFLLLIPIWPYQQHFLESISLYFQKFEFNGSIYEIWKAIDFRRLGYNNIESIGKWLAACVVTAIIFLVSIQKKLNYPGMLRSSLLAWFVYLLLSTTVHPWYVLPVLVLGILSGYFFPVVWSGMVVLSYGWYDTGLSLVWKYFWIGFEYSLVFCVMWYEIIIKNRSDFSTRV